MSKKELDFTHIIEKLQKQAEADGKVTKDEEKFLRKLGQKVEEYQKSLSEAKYDEVISEDEFHELIVDRDQILNQAMEFETGSDDVNNLVQELFNEINKHEIPGMFDDEASDESHGE